jgi:4-amino-4-deoxy-L-arabinose transferase-like glycosyltransferase
MSNNTKEIPLMQAAVIFLIVLRFALALYYPVFSDANMYFYQAKRIATDPSLLINPEIAYFPPLLFIIGAFMHTLLGEIGLKLIAPFFGAVGIYYTYRLGKELFSERAGLLGAIFLGIIPSHIYLSSMGYMDPVVTGLSIAFVYYFYKADTFKRMAFAGLLAGLAGISKVTGIVVFLFIGMNFLIVTFLELCIAGRKEIFSRNILRHIPLGLFKKSIIVGTVGALISAPYYLRNWVLFGQVLEPVGKTIHYARTFDPDVFYKAYSSVMEVAYKSTFVGGVSALDYIMEIFFDFWGLPKKASGVISFIPDFAIHLFTLFAVIISVFYLAGVLLGVRNKNSLIIYSWLATWGVLMTISLSSFAWGFRRLLPLAPFLALLAGYQFSRIDRALLKKFAYLLLILSLIAFPVSQIGKAWYAKSWFDKYSDSLEYLKTIPDDSIVLTPYEEQTIYYSEKKTMLLNNLRPDALNLTTLRRYNITHVVRTDSFIWFDLGEHNRKIDSMAEKGDLILLWESEHVKVYRTR